MITAGRSMHWMDTSVVLPWIYNHLTAGGTLLLVGERNQFWRSKEAWCQKIAELIEKFTGQDLAVSQKSLILWQDMLTEFPYTKIDSYKLPIKTRWDIDHLLGFLLSTSICSPDILGDKCASFQKQLAAELYAINPDGVFLEENVLSVVIAKKIKQMWSPIRGAGFAPKRI